MLPNPILILDFGSQYTQLIARRIRQCQVYCEVHPYSLSLQQAQSIHPCGVILSGGPDSVYQSKAPTLSFDPQELGVPILGICYGAQWLAQFFGGQVIADGGKEFGSAQLIQVPAEKLDPFLEGISISSEVWMSHGDHIQTLPRSFRSLAKTEQTPFAVFVDSQKKIYGIQFHPEVSHTSQGRIFLRNFLFQICHASPDYTMNQLLPILLTQIQEKVGDGFCLCGLSGGVDSMVTASLLWKAIGKRTSFFFVDTGLLRKNEAAVISTLFAKTFQAPLAVLSAQERFFSALQGVIDPEEKRKRIGHLFIQVFQEASESLQQQQNHSVSFLAQGTIYPDVIESAVSPSGPSVTIKTHHNVGGLPPNIGFSLVEPLRFLFKDEVRLLGKELGLPDSVLNRHPFPGPGLAVRIMGEVTKQRVFRLQQADAIVEEEMKQSGIYSELWQAFAVLLPMKTVGVMGDYRTYAEVIAIRAVQSQDGMTANFAEIPFPILSTISRRIVNEVDGINRVVYDITSKPPATIEWE